VCRAWGGGVVVDLVARFVARSPTTPPSARHSHTPRPHPTTQAPISPQPRENSKIPPNSLSCGPADCGMAWLGEEAWTNAPAAVEVLEERRAADERGEEDRVHVDGVGVRVRTRPSTDMWERTHYGFERDSAHWCPTAAPLGDWECSLRLRGDFRRDVQYDQAGLALRPVVESSSLGRSWLKAGIECVDGKLQASVVVTRTGLSDWSTTPIAEEDALHGILLRLQRRGDAVFVHWKPAHVLTSSSSSSSSSAPPSSSRYGADGWRLMRLAAVPLEWGPLRVGPMACSPDDSPGGFVALFDRFALRPLERPSRAALAPPDAASDASGIRRVVQPGAGPSGSHEWFHPVDGEPSASAPRPARVPITAGARLTWMDAAAPDAATPPSSGDAAGVAQQDLELATALAEMRLAQPHPHRESLALAHATIGVPDEDDEIICDMQRKELLRARERVQRDREQAIVDLLDAVASSTEPRPADKEE
jgi:regulation of enolase protein 1 (concanavalin A-like superfamily)